MELAQAERGRDGLSQDFSIDDLIGLRGDFRNGHGGHGLPQHPKVPNVQTRRAMAEVDDKVKNRKAPVPPELDSPQIREDFAAFRRSTVYFSEHYKELLDEFPDRWIALWVDAAGVRTVISGKDVDAVARKARKRKMPLARSYLRFMATQPRFYIWTLVVRGSFGDEVRPLVDGTIYLSRLGISGPVSAHS